jgi:hypothetical protein
MSEAVRQAFEQKVLSGEQLSAPKIRRARGRLKGGSPNRRQPDQPARMGIAAFPLTSARAPRWSSEDPMRCWGTQYGPGP